MHAIRAEGCRLGEGTAYFVTEIGSGQLHTQTSLLHLTGGWRLGGDSASLSAREKG